MSIVPIKKDEEVRKAVSREAKAIHQLLGIGLTTLRKSNMDNAGSYYAAFSTLTIGIERACKLTITLDALSAKGRFLTDKELKSRYHQLRPLVDEVVEIRTRRGSDPKYGLPTSDLVSAAVDFLHRSASSKTRYYNLDFLSGVHQSGYSDLVSEWTGIVLKNGAPQKPLTAAQNRDIAQAKFIDEHGLLISLGRQSEEGATLDTAEDLTRNAHRAEHVQEEGSFAIAQIARFCVDSLTLVTDASGLGIHLEEVFTVLRQPDSILRKRKRFDSYY
jgi:hypothetical protein